MQKWKAFVAALLLFAVTVTGFHLAALKGAHVSDPDFAMWADEKKSKSRTAIVENLNTGTIPVFGSSEFQHGIKTEYHPAKMFQNTEFHPMLIGAGYYQSLSHAITLSSIAEELPVKAAVLFVSPQWFRKTGVVDQAFASRFSESHYIGMLENKNLTDKTRNYIEKRTHLLLKPDEKTKDRVLLYEKVIKDHQGSVQEKGYVNLYRSFLNERETLQTLAGAGFAGLTVQAKAAKTSADIDWNGYIDKAVKEAKKEKQNPFFIQEKSYRKLKPFLKKKKGQSKNAVNGYQESPEYDDLRCFLDVCRENEIQPMLVILPVNGYYYDYTKFPKEARAAYYDKIRKIAAEYGAETADFSGDEYTKYFFEDQVHIGGKGWVEVNESLYQFYQNVEAR